MKYAHTDVNGQLIGWYDVEIHATIPTPSIEVTDDTWQEALDNHHNKVNSDGTTELFDFRTTEDVAAGVRGMRDLLLQTEVDPVVTNPLRWADLTEAKQAEWTTYRRALLDITEQSGFPHNVTWPTKPTQGV